MSKVFILFYFILIPKTTVFPVDSEGEGAGFMVYLHRLDIIDAGPTQD